VRGGENVSDWVVTITDRPSELSGALIDEAGRPAPGYWILVYARDRAFWTNGSRRIVQMRAGVDGRFSFAGLPAGEYLIAALADLEPLESLPPAFLESLVAASVRVTIADRQRTVQDLRIGR
jgi:hypothetical protein